MAATIATAAPAAPQPRRRLKLTFKPSSRYAPADVLLSIHKRHQRQAAERDRAAGKAPLTPATKAEVLSQDDINRLFYGE